MSSSTKRKISVQAGYGEHNVCVEYAGDGVYVEYDGYAIILKTNNHLLPTDIVYLEPEVWDAVLRIVKEFKTKERPGAEE